MSNQIPELKFVFHSTIWQNFSDDDVDTALWGAIGTRTQRCVERAVSAKDATIRELEGELQNLRRTLNAQADALLQERVTNVERGLLISELEEQIETLQTLLPDPTLTDTLHVSPAQLLSAVQNPIHSYLGGLLLSITLTNY
jgi:hypothetical protein